jgi:hypothetical protein
MDKLISSLLEFVILIRSPSADSAPCAQQLPQSIREMSENIPRHSIVHREKSVKGFVEHIQNIKAQVPIALTYTAEYADSRSGSNKNDH